MYYSKYFEGSVEADTATTIYAPLLEGKGSSTTTIGTALGTLKASVVGNAIVSTLHDCGLTGARYAAENGYLYLDYDNSNIGFYLGSYSSMAVRASIGFNGNRNSTRLYITGYSDTNSGRYINLSVMFSDKEMLTAADYKFCVTVRGDTKSMFTIYLGTYSSPTSITNVLGTFYFGVDKRNDDKVFGCYFNSNPGQCYIFNGQTLLPYVFFSITSEDPGTVSPTSKLTIVDNNVVLIEDYIPTVPFIAFDNIFIDPGFGKSGQFYEIDGEVYFCYTPYFIKCTTPVTPTEG